MIGESLSVSLVYSSLPAADPRNILYRACTPMLLGAAATVLVGRGERPGHTVAGSGRR